LKSLSWKVEVKPSAPRYPSMSSPPARLELELLACLERTSPVSRKRVHPSVMATAAP
jgi:hypothetical protein